jgi:hypothetical protein
MKHVVRQNRRDVVVDLGGIEEERATEMYVPRLSSLMGTLGASDPNMAVLRA